MARRSRREQVGQFKQVEAELETGRSEREVSEQLKIPRATLQRWRRARLPGEVPVGLAQFIETEEWLHRQVLAAHLVITLLAGAGIRLVCEFLQLSGLAAFVASSYGSQHKINMALQEAVLAYAEQQRLTLGQAMPEREIAVCEDETYHPEICPVGLEPVSNFILLECYAPDRSAGTWTQALEEALKALPVMVVQGTSDKAKGLLRHVEKDLGAHHSLDLFHVQHEVSKATALALARRIEQAHRQRDEAAQQVEQHRQARSAFEAQAPRPPAFEPRIVAALLEHMEAEAHCCQAEEQQQQARQVMRAPSVRPTIPMTYGPDRPSPLNRSPTASKPAGTNSPYWPSRPTCLSVPASASPKRSV